VRDGGYLNFATKAFTLLDNLLYNRVNMKKVYPTGQEHKRCTKIIIMILLTDNYKSKNKCETLINNLINLVT